MTEASDRSTETEVGRAYRRESFWLDSIDESLDPRPSLEDEIRCDVVIVGAGFSGLWAAYFLKQKAPDLDIVILEKDIAGFGASGRNGGACSAWWDPIYGWLKDPRTHDAAVRLHERLIESVARIGRITAHEGIDCHFNHEGMTRDRGQRAGGTTLLEGRTRDGQARLSSAALRDPGRRGDTHEDRNGRRARQPLHAPFRRRATGPPGSRAREVPVRERSPPIRAIPRPQDRRRGASKWTEAACERRPS